MNAERWRQIEGLLGAALDEPEPAKRSLLLDRACAGDADLRAEVESLLAHHAPSETFIEGPAYAFAAELLAEDWVGGLENRHVGAYKIIREIGRGGMGAVFLAERADGEFRQRVALKVVGHSFADSELKRRFRQERQILASLSHPNIARLLDGGVTADGEPFLAMEYVEGVRIDDYCDARSLSTAGRLRLFLAVCQGIAYAHRHLVVHRDIKPSNILVTEDGAVKLLDFGIAKLIDPGDAGEQTRTELRAFTPDYASPEQVGGGQITTASDVYSLGVLLRDLLNGAGPRVPVRPAPGGWLSRSFGRTSATNLKTDGPEVPHGEKRTGGQRFGGTELENIIAMARREDPARRYASAAQLAEDVQRHLDGLPVHAQKDSFTYRASKFVRRNRLGVAAAAVVLLSLVLGVAATLWQSRRTAEQARIAAQERDRARVEAARAERINAVLQNMLGFSDTTWFSNRPGRNSDVTIAQALDEVGRRAESEFVDQPEVQASVRLLVGRSYMAQNRLDDAERHLREALDIRRRVLGPGHQETAHVLVALAEVRRTRGNFLEAESLLGEAIAVYRRAREAGAVDPKWFWMALNGLAWVQTYRGDPAASEATAREALGLASTFTGVDRSALASTYTSLAMTRRGQGDLDGAIAFQERGVEEFRRLPGEPRDEMGNALGNLAFYVMMKGDHARAEALYLEGLEVYRKTVGDSALLVSIARINLADNYYAQGEYGRAREEVERAVAIQQKLLPDGHVDYGLSYTVLGKVLTRTGDLKGGETYLRRALEARTRALKPGHRWTAETQSALGENLTAQRRYDEAEALLAESHNTLEASLGRQDPRTREARRRLVALYEAWGKPDIVARYAEL